jgi:SAM-dependent methyltransferase
LSFRPLHHVERLCVQVVQPTTRFLFKHTPFSFDHVYGVETEDPIDSLWYQATSRKYFEFAIRQIPEPLDAWSFIDIGSGKGRAVLLALAHPFRRVIGVELDPGLHAIAEANLARYRGPRRCREVELVCAAAQQLVLPPGDVVIFLNNPFTGEPFRLFLDRIEELLSETPRRLLLLYGTPDERRMVEARPIFSLLFEGSVWYDVTSWGTRHIAVFGAGMKAGRT